MYYSAWTFISLLNTDNYQKHMCKKIKFKPSYIVYKYVIVLNVCTIHWMDLSQILYASSPWALVVHCTFFLPIRIQDGRQAAILDFESESSFWKSTGWILLKFYMQVPHGP